MLGLFVARTRCPFRRRGRSGSHWTHMRKLQRGKSAQNNGLRGYYERIDWQRWSLSHQTAGTFQYSVIPRCPETTTWCQTLYTVVLGSQVSSRYQRVKGSPLTRTSWPGRGTSDKMWCVRHLGRLAKRDRPEHVHLPARNPPKLCYWRLCLFSMHMWHLSAQCVILATGIPANEAAHTCI